jgi:lipoprotein NlpI/Tfp pilus assembly protein PilF
VDLSREHPFPGLRPFDFRDHKLFFGREGHTYALYRLLDRSRFVAVVGSSGSGKSSLVRAGLLPLLQEEMDAAGVASWRWVAFHPGDAPMRALREALVSIAIDAELEPDILAKDLETALDASSFGLSKAVQEIPGLSNRKVLLVVDQFEELFRYGSRRDEATNFVQRLLEATRSHSSPIHVLVTMRSDFIGDCAQFQRLPEAVSRSQFLVPSLNRDQREEVILKPIEFGGGQIEPLLVERLLNDGGAEMDQLPVLQHCLLRLWECAPVIDGVRHLNEKEYDHIGGIARALSQHADEVMEELGKPLEPVVESVFRALSETDSDGRATRRALPFAELLAETGVPQADLRRVIERFTADDCSFLVLSTPTLNDETQIDVAHEALLRNWVKISAPLSVKVGRRESGWLAAEAEDGWEYRALLSLVRSGSAGGKVTLPLDQVDSRYNWWRSRKRTSAWAERYGGGFALVEKLFADSKAELEKRKEEERLAAQTERDRQVQIEKRRRDEELRRVQDEFARVRARRTRIAAVAMALLAILALSSAAWALVKNQQLTIANKAAETLNEKLTQANAQLQQVNGKKDALIKDQTVKGKLLAAQKNQLAKADAKVTSEKLKLAAANANLSISNEKLVSLGARVSALREEERVHSAVSEVKMLKQYVAAHPNDSDAHVDLGDAFQGGGKLPDAAMQFRTAIALNPKDAYAYASLCDITSQRANAMRDADPAKKKDLLEALAYCQSALSIAPNMTYALRAEALVEYSLSQLPGGKNGDLAVAERNLSHAIAIDSSEAISWRYMCEVQFQANHYDAAVRYCEGAIKADNKQPMAYYMLGRAKFAQQAWAPAIVAFTRAIGLSADLYRAYYWRGRARIGDGQVSYNDLSAAERDLTYVLQNDAAVYGVDEAPYNAHYWRGVAEVLAGDPGAVDDLSAALKSNPGDSLALFWRGRAELRQQDWGAAIADLSRTNESTTRYYLAYARLHTADYRQALRDIQQYIVRSPNDGDGYLLLARIELNAGDPARALEDANKARALYNSEDAKSSAQGFADEVNSIAQHGLRARFVADSQAVLANSRNARALTDRGDVYEGLGYHTPAISDYSAAIAADPSDAYAFAARCQSKEENSSTAAEFKSALADCNKALDLNPNFAYALRQRAIIDLALVNGDDLKDLTAADRDANRAVALAPQAASGFLTRCFVYVTMNRYNEATTDCSAAIKLAPDATIGYYWRASARLHTGDYTSGLADVQDYLSANPRDAAAYLLKAKLELRMGRREQAKASADTALRYYQDAKNKVGAESTQQFLNHIDNPELQASQ